MKNPAPGVTASGAAPAEERAERRSARRHILTATVQIVEMKSGVRIASRTHDLSRGGCFLDVLAPLPVGSRVRLLLSRHNSSFETVGRVTYAQGGLGMGIVFTDTSTEQQQILDAWLEELQGDVEDEGPEPSASVPRQDALDQPLPVVEKLVRLLIARGVISDEDGRALFNDAAR